jgi:hypothetical protein
MMTRKHESRTRIWRVRGHTSRLRVIPLEKQQHACTGLWRARKTLQLVAVCEAFYIQDCLFYEEMATFRESGVFW